MADEFNTEGIDPNNLPGNTANTVPNSTQQQSTVTAQGDEQPPAPPPAEPVPPAILTNTVGQITNPQAPPGTTYTPTPQQVTPQDLLNSDGSLNPAFLPGVATRTPTYSEVRTATAPEKTGPASYEAYTGGEVKDVEAQQGQISEEAKVQAAQQADLSPELKKTLDDFNADLDAIGVDKNMTVAGQYEQLMNFGPDEIPSWAAGAYRKAQAELAKRGIASSTMAGEAITTALMQAALPIASQDAKVFETLKLTKLDKKAQGVFLRAGYIAQLDMKNLDNRQQAAVVNSQSFLAMDLKNLDNRQQAAIINTQSRLQKLLADNAAINASRQFNAQSQQQNDQFFANLGAEMEKFNSSVITSNNQFNAGVTNATDQFYETMNNNRSMFNSNLSFQIAQSNTDYMRRINTANTATLNQAQLVNSQNLLGISSTAMANMFQLLRDQTAYSFQAGENDKDRTNRLQILNIQNAEWFKRLDAETKNGFLESLGGLASSIVGDFLESFDWSFGSTGGTRMNEGGP